MTPEQAIKVAKERGYLDGLTLNPSSGISAGTQSALQDALKQTKSVLNSREVPNQEQAPDHPSTNATNMCLFISASMPRAAFLAAMNNAAESGIIVYINGMFEEDKNILDTRRRLLTMTQDFAKKPNVRFGPTWFEKYQIDRVPAMVFDDGHTHYRKIYGVSLTKFFQQEIDASRKLDLGTFGNTYAVKEKSLIDQIKMRMAAIDWQSKAKVAVQRYWQKSTFYPLPPAEKNDTFYIDPTVSITKDVFNGRGDLLAKAGTKFNPLTTLPNAHLRLYIIDPNNSQQLKWLDTFNGKFEPRDQIIVSNLDRSRGWDQMSYLRKRYQHDIYILDKTLIQRFSLKALPVTVGIEKGFLKIQEFNVEAEQ
jgi:conjugal transfer pilus assembly protein TraW